MNDSRFPGIRYRSLVAAFVVAALTVIGVGYFYYQIQAAALRRSSYENIAAIAQMKVGQIEQWRRDRLMDVVRDAHSEGLSEALQSVTMHTESPEIRARVLRTLQIVQRGSMYCRALTLNPFGHVWMNTGKGDISIGSATRRAVDSAADSSGGVISDFFRDAEGNVAIDIVAAVRDAKGNLQGFVVLRSMAGDYLYPLIQSWPTPSPSAETLLVEQEGKEVVFLNELRHRANTALSFRHSIREVEMPAVQAALGVRGMFNGKDYRGIRILADLRAIPGSSWLMVTKVDAAEILTEARYRAGLISVIVAAFILLVAAATAYVYRRRQARLFLQLFKSERHERETQELYRLTLYSIGDGVLTTDTAGFVREMNAVAERLTGWSEKEARGKPLDEVFIIVNQETRALVTNPVSSVLSNGAIVGLANHTVLISRDGTERPIADSAAPIRGEDGEVSGVVLVFSDVTEQYQMQEALRKSEQELRMLFEAMQEGFALHEIICDESGQPVDYRFLSVNPAFEQITGLCAKNVVGRTVREVIPGIEPHWIERYGRVALTGEPVRFEEYNATLNRYFKIAAYSAQPRRFAAMFEDITESKEAHAAVLDAKRLAEEASRLKGEFLANMSHEIRTPMSGVMGLTGLLFDTPLDPQQREYARMISECADALLTVINDILDFSKIEARKLTLETVDFDLLNTVEGAVEINAGRARSRGIELVDFVDPALSSQFRGDSGRLRQVLTNLLSNAIKFTEKGEVVLTVSQASETATEALLRFEIRDTGIGITREAQSRLFEAFNQADGSTTRKYGGTGLGLAICKQLVAMMHGEIGVRSEQGRGSTFWFTVRLEKRSDSPKQAPAKEASQAALAGLRVLIVDDNAAHRQVLQCYLASRNIEADSAASGNEALEILERAQAEAPYQLAIVDMEMAEMDGLALVRSIKASSRTSHMRVVLLTALGEMLSDEAGRNVDAWLIKPIKQSSLFESVARAMGNHPGEAVVVPGTARPCRILLAEDNPVNRIVTVAHLKQMGYRADLAPNGVEVLRLMRQTAYDIILMDCQMPDMDGYETTRRIRVAASDPCRPYIIALTAHANSEAGQECFEAGMNDYLSKPVQFTAFATALSKGILALGQESAQEEPTKPEEGISE